MLNTKDFEKVQYYEKEYFEKENYFNHRFRICNCVDYPCACDKSLKFRMTDDSLKNVGINAGDALNCSFDFEPFNCLNCLFIVSLSGGAMVARFVDIEGGNFLLSAANEQIPDLVCFGDVTDIVGLVTPKIEKPLPEYESDFDVDYSLCFFNL